MIYKSRAVLLFFFPHHWVHFLSGKPSLSSSFFYILSQSRAYLFYTPFTYIMSLSLRANFKRTWISELSLCSWENTMLPTEKEGVLLLSLPRRWDDQDNCPGSASPGVGWDPDKTQGALSGATGMRKYLPSPTQRSGCSDYCLLTSPWLFKKI